MIQFPFPLDNPWVLLFDGLISISLFMYILKYLLFFREIKNWKKINGLIQECKFNKGSINNETSDKISITYSYEVNGKKYFGNVVNVSEYIFPKIIFSQNPFVARKIYSLFQANADVVIYHKESAPEFSCLDKSFDKRAVIIMILCLAIFLGFLVYYGFKWH